MTETRIYVGLNDAVDRSQHFGTEKYKSILKTVCRSYHVPFSVTLTEGGYFHDDGEYTEENTLVITLIDVPEQTIGAIAGDLCAFFRQESVLVTGGEVRAYFVRETLE